jgi:hypothetical protein
MDKWLKRKIIEEDENSNNNNIKCEHDAKIEIKRSAKTEIPKN